METDAPNFAGRYPLAGEKIGPAWQSAWNRLSATKWIEGPEIVEHVTTLHPLTAQTIKGLLAKARRAGVLDVQYRMHPTRRRRVAYYRVSVRTRLGMKP